MILPQVSELLQRVSRRAVVEEVMDTIRRSDKEVRLSGLTNSAKALILPLAFAKLGRPTTLLVASNTRAEAMIEPIRWFYRAVTGKPAHRVAYLPAQEILPYENRSPHAEISEARAVSLWRFAMGEADLLIAPVQAAMWRMRQPEFYRQLARTVERDESIAHEDLIGFLAGAGYEKQATCEMPGQFSVRGGIIDVFSPETLQPVRIELLGDTIESIRAFDPNTQRSTSPVERATLLPLTEFPHPAEVLQRSAAARSASGREDEMIERGFYPGWEFREILRQERNSVLFDLAGDPLLVLDEPSALESEVENYRNRLAKAFEEVEDPLAEPPDRYIYNEEEWQLALDLFPRLALEHLGLAQEGSVPLRNLQTQPTTRYHGNVAAFMAEVKGRLTSGEQVMVSAASTGELERFADICHEYELPYRLGELEENVTVTRLAEEGSSGNTPAMVLVKAPLAEGVAFPEAQLTIFGNGDLFETLAPSSPRSRARPKTASFFSDLSDLKPGDFVVHVDHGIGQFEGLRQVGTDGATGEFMLLIYADEARLYVPLARLDLIQKYQSLGGVKPTLDRLGTTIWESRKTRVRKSVDDMAGKLLALYAERKTAAGHAFPPDSNWQREFEDAFEFEETPDQLRAIDDAKRDMESTLPMDRLLCGDVGYGKTEVAMRAAFKAIADSKQVAVLAPTTVLAFQHYETFRRRFSPFPVRIDMLSRFRS
jgi:transcription-repair coupling factor (superfamily II helicase)